MDARSSGTHWVKELGDREIIPVFSGDLVETPYIISAYLGQINFLIAFNDSSSPFIGILDPFQLFVK